MYLKTFGSISFNLRKSLKKERRRKERKEKKRKREKKGGEYKSRIKTTLYILPLFLFAQKWKKMARDERARQNHALTNEVRKGVDVPLEGAG